MSYSFTRSFYRKNLPIIEDILHSLREGKEIQYDAAGVDNPTKISYFFHRLLAAAQFYGETEEIRSIKTSITVKSDPIQRIIRLVPKGASASSPPPLKKRTTQADLKNLLSSLRSSGLTLTTIEVAEDIDEEDLILETSKIGYILHTSTKEVLPGGVVRYAVEKSSTPTPTSKSSDFDPDEELARIMAELKGGN